MISDTNQMSGQPLFGTLTVNFTPGSGLEPEPISN